ncbi:MAG: RDD family protein [Mobilicoccus sp.]|nr:RDD family protein [Mobilicoccus sp.]
MDERPTGWYDDPDEPTRLRYWDGSSWTDRTHEKAPMPPPQPARPPVTRLRPTATREETATAEAPTAERAPETTGHVDGPRPWSDQPGARRSEPSADDDQRPAGVLRRAMALIVDLTLVLFVVALIAMPFMGDVIAASNSWWTAALEATRSGNTIPDPPAVVTAASATLSMIFGVSLVLYEVLLLARWGATPGRWLTGARVRSADGGDLELGALLRRSIVKYAFMLLQGVALVGLLAYVFFIFDVTRALTNPMRETLHEKWSGTRSVRPVRRV